MKKKLDLVLLIDDSEADNYYHQLILEEADCAERVMAMELATQALEFLKNRENPRPDLIFLDINMPGMNGWDFLSAYEGLDETLRGSVIVVMLTTSTDRVARDKATASPHVRAFQTKPLNVKMLEEILQKLL